ncbi:polysaccharide biosynthesis protein [Acidisphaera rubrifaciens]|uniref:Polysaccharide biosynthesis nucleotide sugar epimerase dehydratase n=1 Tax=Acidisphaera rubrifaciens HS-AP3 TaxID=1231350 RepID=A0A0D6P3I3_9PROT|nr:nucleoside-diphosphate sugar epimerase/dehydratase [Acidisphaera rubrifaciens]GAN76320.1 polysaccharide biosynthesis nucleotide sugar epimerase dehydratase [Acidisphaera rubrifaciens HS-AP3]
MAPPSKPGSPPIGRQPGHRALRIVLNVLIDGSLAAAAVPAARWVADPHAQVLLPLHQYVVGAVSLLLAGLPFRLSFQYWRFAGLADLMAVANASVLGAVFFIIVARLIGPAVPSPGFSVIHALVLLVLLGAPRVAYRRLRLRPAGRPAEDAPAAVVVGAAEDADLFLRALAQDRMQPMRIAGLLSASARQAGRRIQGLPILGGVDEAAGVLDRMAAEGRLPAMLVVASPLDPRRLGDLINTAERFGIAVRRAARPTALSPAVATRGPALQLQPVAIEDLLNRRQVALDREGMARLIQGRRVIVTGAGGTIGSELARQVAAFGPETLVLLDNGEYALWQIDTELAETHPHVPRRAVIADIRDEARVRALFDAVRPALVFHAAALKHVPMVEANPLEGLLTNAVGTRHVADAARAAGAAAMVLISTDKAVNPTSVMGASKRLAEMYCQGLDIAALERPGEGAMRCITVRFGNVLGSTGSVVPLFQRQLERGGPLTVTHPDMQRYFMTVREAVGLVLQASVVGTAPGATLPSARQGGIFVLDMGAPVKIVDLARQMIRLAGLRPEQDVEIRFTGLRPGEKLFEELFHGHEPPAPTPYPGLLMATPRTADPALIGRALDEMAALCRTGAVPPALALLARLIPEFDHADTRAHG